MKIHNNWIKEYRRRWNNIVTRDSVVIIDDGNKPKWSIDIFENDNYSHTIDRARTIKRAEQIARQFMNRVYDIESKSKEAVRIEEEQKKSLALRERLRKISGI